MLNRCYGTPFDTIANNDLFAQYGVTMHRSKADCYTVLLQHGVEWLNITTLLPFSNVSRSLAPVMLQLRRLYLHTFGLQNLIQIIDNASQKRLNIFGSVAGTRGGSHFPVSLEDRLETQLLQSVRRLRK